MKVREFHRFLARTTGASIGEIDQRTRFLRATGEIQSGKRGPWAPDISPEEAARVLLALVSRRAADSHDVYMRAVDLTALPRGTTELMKGQKLGSVIASMLILENWQKGDLIQQVEIEENGEFARLRLESESILFTNNSEMWRWVKENPEVYDNQYRSQISRVLILSDALLNQIALEIDKKSSVGKMAAD